MRSIASLALTALGISFTFLLTPFTHAQIVGQFEADIHHEFTVGEATLPPGKYIFRTTAHTSSDLMTVTSQDGKTSDEFVVRRSVDSHVPHHDELIFDRYGQQEFLTHIYEHGEKVGATIIEPSREEARMQKQGSKPVEHTEEQTH